MLFGASTDASLHASTQVKECQGVEGGAEGGVAMESYNGTMRCQLRFSHEESSNFQQQNLEDDPHHLYSVTQAYDKNVKPPNKNIRIASQAKKHASIQAKATQNENNCKYLNKPEWSVTPGSAYIFQTYVYILYTYIYIYNLDIHLSSLFLFFG